MSTMTLKLSSVNQITLPRAVRELLGVKAGDEVEVSLRNNVVQLRRAETHEEKVRRVFREMEEWNNNLPEEVKANIRKHAGWTINQYHEYYDNLPETKAYIKEKYGV